MAEELHVGTGHLLYPPRFPNTRDTDQYFVRGSPASTQSLLQNSGSGIIGYSSVTIGSSTRYLRRVLIHSSSALVLSLGIGVALFLYLSKGKLEWNKREFVTLVPQGNVLLITAIASKIVLTTCPLVMGIAAYYIANDWVLHTKLTFERARSIQLKPSVNAQSLPTPFQYALILKMFQGASIFSLWNALRYLFRSSSKRRKFASRPLFHSLLILLILLFLSYSLMAVDFALHSLSLTRFLSAKGEPIPLPQPSSSEAKLYGRELKASCHSLGTNGTACTSEQRPPSFWGSYTIGYEEGYRTLSDLSNSTRIAYAPLTTSSGLTVQVALLTPANASTEVSFTASTIGVYTQCSSVAPYCDPNPGSCNPNFHPTNLSWVEDETFTNCTYIPCLKPEWPIYWVEGFMNLSASSYTLPMEMRRDPQVNDGDIPSEIVMTDKNPFRFLSKLSSYIDPDIASSACAEYSSSTGRCIRGTDEAFLYSGSITNNPTPDFRLLPLGCSVTIINAHYTYLNGTYRIDPSTISLSDSSTTLAISSVLYTRDAPTEFIFDAAINLAQIGESSEVVLAKVEENTSRLLASMALEAFDTIPITQQSRVNYVAATVLPTPLLLAFFGLLIMHAVLIVILTGSAAAVSKEAISYRGTGDDGKRNVKNVVELARRRLCEPASLVYELFESQDDHEGRWMKGAGIEMFDEGSNGTGTMARGREHEAFINKPSRGVRLRVVGVGIRPDGGFGFSTE